MDFADVRVLCERLKRGPAILFLGQDYLRLDTGLDPFLSEVLRKYGKPGEKAKNYRELLETEAKKSPEHAIAWMHELSKRLPAPDWLARIASYPWSCVYTSAIDAIWITSFRAAWRELQPVFDEVYKPSDPRNKAKLHCTFLFGCVDRTDEEQRPPLTPFEWRKRKQVAVSLARRIPEILTPMGTLIIEGYGTDDWLSLDDLLPIVDSLGSGQAYIFSATQELSDHADVSELVRKGLLKVLPQSLAVTLLAGKEAGVLQIGLPADEETLGRRIQLEDKTIVVPHDIWSQTARSATILDDSLFLDPRPLSQDARYREFRSFLSGANGKPQWSAYARGLAYSRSFERELRREVDYQLAQRRLSDTPIILHGQTGTGKTVALGALAYAIRRENKYPVLFIERRLQRPLQADVDRFCKWAEDSGAPSCLVIWDGMLNQEEYSDFLSYLTGRGRKVVLLGSCYGIRGSANKRVFIHAPARLSPQELSEFVKFLRSFDPAIETILARLSTIDEFFLAALYRLLPGTRSQIRVGVSGEATHVEDHVARKAAQIAVQIPPRTALEEALRASGIISGQLPLHGKAIVVDGELVGEMQDFTGLVMVPGQFGLTVPLELLMRAWGKKAYSKLPLFFGETDFFAWYEDSTGNIEVGPRNKLEAELVIQGRMGGPRMQVEYVQRLLLNVSEGGDFGDARETNFAVNLLDALPDSFLPYFRDLSLTLRRLREDRSVINARIMLQEANLLRRWAISKDRAGIVDAQIDEAFEEVQPILKEAIGLVTGERRGRKLQTFLLVESAAALASNARHKVNSPAEALRLFEAARKSIHDARVLDAGNYHAVDVLAWATRDLMDQQVFDRTSKEEALADVLHAFETVDSTDFDSVQSEKFHQRRLEFAQLLDLEEMEQDAFDSLSTQGSGAGYYLRALHLSGLSRRERREVDPNDRRLPLAYQYLEENRLAINRDVRCLELMLDLWWLINTRSRLFDGERRTIGLNQGQWQNLLDIIDALEVTGESNRPVVLAYLRGLALFHLGDTVHSLEVFRNVERESDLVRGRRRIIRSYLVSTPAGEPRKFQGTVARLYAEGARGEVYVDDLRHRIPFIPYEFQKGDIHVHGNLGEFHIAFNFLGPIADPLAYQPKT